MKSYSLFQLQAIQKSGLHAMDHKYLIELTSDPKESKLCFKTHADKIQITDLR